MCCLPEIVVVVAGLVALRNNVFRFSLYKFKTVSPSKKKLRRNLLVDGLPVVVVAIFDFISLQDTLK